MEWCEREGREFIYPRAVYQFGPSSIRNKKAASAATVLLVEHGYLRPIPEGMTLDGAHRREVWQLIRRAEHE